MHTYSYNHDNLELLLAGILRLSCFDMKSTSDRKPLRLGFLPASPAREEILLANCAYIGRTILIHNIIAIALHT